MGAWRICGGRLTARSERPHATGQRLSRRIARAQPLQYSQRSRELPLAPGAVRARRVVRRGLHSLGFNVRGITQVFDTLFTGMGALNQLDLSGNELKAVPGLSSQTVLRRLYLSSNKLTAVPGLSSRSWRPSTRCATIS